MSIEGIAALASTSEVLQAPASMSAGEGSPAFGALLDSISDVSSQMKSNELQIQALALGETDNLHQVIMNLESTRLEFDLMLQVRNKVLDAYQELMRMQV